MASFFPRAKLPEELASFLCDPSPPRADTDQAEAEEEDDADNALAAAEPSGPVPPHGLPLVHARGRVCSLRMLGRAMQFFDLVDPGVQPGQGHGALRLECLIHGKGLAGLTHQEARARRHIIHIGDLVHCWGYLDTSRGHLILEPRGFRVLEAWKTAHEPRVSFMLRYPNKATTGPAAPDEPAVPHDDTSRANNRSDDDADNGSSDHSASASPTSTPPRLAQTCKYWVNSNGKCFRGAACPHFHPPLAALAHYRAAWVRRRAAERALASHLEGDTHDPLQDKTHKAARARLFADWIVATYGAEALRANGGVCDVGGGHGDVSVRLWCEHGVPCTVIEPRPIGLRRRQRKQVKRRGVEGIGRLTCEMQVGWRFREGTQGEAESEEQARLRAALEGCALIIGMHPDEATDAIVDVAHEYGKPFACVPCCVFSRVFPHRRTPGGEAVETYEHLVAYLRAKPCVGEGGVLRGFLPFHGRNQVLYSLPEGRVGKTSVVGDGCGEEEG